MPPTLSPPAFPVVHCWRLPCGGTAGYFDADRKNLAKRWPYYSTCLPRGNQRYVSIGNHTHKIQWHNLS